MKRNQCGNHQPENSPAGGDCVGTPAMGASREGPWRRQGVRQSSKDDAEEGEGQEQEVRLGVEVETQKQILKYDEEEKEEEEEDEEEEEEEAEDDEGDKPADENVEEQGTAPATAADVVAPKGGNAGVKHSRTSEDASNSRQVRLLR